MKILKLLRRIKFYPKKYIKRRKKMNANLLEQFEELKVLVESIQKDVLKNHQGNKSAGVRARKGLRQVKKMAADLVKTSLDSDKTT